MVDLTPSVARHLRAAGGKPATITAHTRAVRRCVAHSAATPSDGPRADWKAAVRGLASASSTIRMPDTGPVASGVRAPEEGR